MEDHTRILSLITSGITNSQEFRNAIRVMTLDRWLTWGRIVVVAEVTMDLIRKYPEERNEIFQVLIDYCTVSQGHWNRI